MPNKKSLSVIDKPTTSKKIGTVKDREGKERLVYSGKILKNPNKTLDRQRGL